MFPQPKATLGWVPGQIFLATPGRDPDHDIYSAWTPRVSSAGAVMNQKATNWRTPWTVVMGQSVMDATKGQLLG